ncbi:MAG TPA: hypothetical protein VGB73_15720 [Pyrinomonadaceae bacterium]
MTEGRTGRAEFVPPVCFEIRAYTRSPARCSEKSGLGRRAKSDPAQN